MPIDLQDYHFSEFPLFAGIEPEAVRSVLSLGFHFRYEAGTPLVSYNDVGETFFQILNGMAKLVLVNVQGEDVSVTIFRNGDFFGELSMLEPKVLRSANIVAISEIEVVAIQKKDFLFAMEDHPRMALNLARVLGQRLRAMNERIVTYGMPDDMHRVAHTLLMLAKKGRMFSEEGTVLLPPLSLKEWALFCFTSGETLMDALEELKDEGAVEFSNQRIAVKNIEVLQKLAEVHQRRLENQIHPATTL